MREKKGTMKKYDMKIRNVGFGREKGGRNFATITRG